MQGIDININIFLIIIPIGKLGDSSVLSVSEFRAKKKNRKTQTARLQLEVTSIHSNSKIIIIIIIIIVDYRTS